MPGLIYSKGTGVNDSAFGKSQYPIRKIIEDRMEAFNTKSALAQIFVMMDSNRFAEKFVGRTVMDNFEAGGENGLYPRSDVQDGYDKTIEPDTWKNSFAISQEMIEDADDKRIKQRAKSFTDAYNRTREAYGGAMLAGGIGTSIVFASRNHSTTTADKKALFATDHPSVLDEADATKQQSNKFSDAFNVNTLSAMETAMQNFKDDKGNILSVTPNTIIIPNNYELKRDVFSVIGADKDPETANNGYNYQFGRWNVIIWSYLAAITGATKPWMLLDSDYNENYDGLLLIDRIPLSVKSIIDETNDANVWKGRARFKIGFNDWRCIALGGITGGTEMIAAG